MFCFVIKSFACRIFTVNVWLNCCCFPIRCIRKGMCIVDQFLFPFVRTHQAKQFENSKQHTHKLTFGTKSTLRTQRLFSNSIRFVPRMDAIRCVQWKRMRDQMRFGHCASPLFPIVKVIGGFFSSISLSFSSCVVFSSLSLVPALSLVDSVSFAFVTQP